MSQDLGISPRARYEESGPLCEAAEGVAETQQCLGATQQVRGSPKGGKNGLDGFED